MSKALQEQINRIKRISKLNEGYSIEDIRKEEKNVLYEEDPELDMDVDMDVEAEGGEEGQEDPFADESGEDLDMDIDMDAEGGDEEITPEGEDDVVELDVTDIVTKSEEALKAIQDTNMSIDNINAKIDNVYSVVANLTQLTDTMSNLVNNVARDVDLMKPPTEAEKKEALEKTSYPFNTSIDDYRENREGKQTQTDLENEKKTMSLEDLAKGYNEKDVRNSFSPDDENDEKLKRFNNRLAGYRN